MGQEGSHPEFQQKTLHPPLEVEGCLREPNAPWASLPFWPGEWPCGAPPGARVEGSMSAMGLLLLLQVPALPFINRETKSLRGASLEVPQPSRSHLRADLGLTGPPARASVLAAPCGGSWQGGRAGSRDGGPAGSTFLDKGVPRPHNEVILSSIKGRDARDKWESAAPTPDQNEGHPGFGYGSGGLGAQKTGCSGTLSRVSTG